MLARTLVLSATFLVALLFTGCSSAHNRWSGVTEPVKAVVSFPPLYSFVASVGGERVKVVSLCTTTGPHGYTYNTSDSYLLQGADVVFALGVGLDDRFVDRAVVNAGNPKFPTNVIKLGEQLVKDVKAKKPNRSETLILYGYCDHPDHQGEKHHHPDDVDAHMWAGVAQAKVFVEMIRDNLSRIDPEGSSVYEANAKKYLETMEKLREDGRKQLKDKKHRQIVTFHASMAYFADTFNLTVSDTIRKVPTDNPTTPEFKKLVEKCKQDNVRLVAVEPQYPKEGVVHTLLKELNKGVPKELQTVVVELDPMETAQEKDLAADWYEKKMRENLKVLAKELP